MSILRLENVGVGYHKSLVSDIHLKIGQGKLICLLGENGCGKSTLMKTLFKIIPPHEGEIYFNDKNIKQIDARRWSQTISAVFSRVGSIPMIPVKELIEIGTYKKDEELTAQIVQLLEIDDLLSKYATEISDGQLQKAMIARALVQDTDFVFFDEPTAHLDFKAKSQVFNLLKKLVQSTQKTFIVITHEVLYALEMADEIWYIHQGKLYQGTPQEVDQKFTLRKQVLNLKYNES